MSGRSVGGAGDVNSDGYADIIIGAASNSAIRGAGKSYVLFAMMPLQVAANSITMTYGGIIPTPTVSYTGFVNSEGPSDLIIQPTASTAANATSTAGNYIITVSGGVSSHYYFVYANGTIIINKAPLHVIANNVATTYGTTATLIQTYSGFVNSEGPANLITQPTVSTAATATSVPGNYTIAVSIGVSDNYAFHYNNGTLTINKAPLYVTAHNVTMVYETNIPILTISYSGFVNSEGPTNLIIRPIATTKATVISEPGIYPIKASGGVSYQDS